MSVIAFHEKAGRSQVGSVFFCWTRFFFPPSWPLSPCFHPHSRGANHFARCMLGVLGSAGAAICLAPCGSARQSGTWARQLTQSPELGFGLLIFLFLDDFDFVFLRCFMQLSPRSFGCCCAMVRTLRRSPTGDAVTRPAFLRSPRWLVSSRSSPRVRPVSVPSA